MLQIIKDLLLKIVNDIDAGNCNLSDSQAMEVMEGLKKFNSREKKLSKYSACRYLNISRATFDNYVREGKLPKGNHTIGFKELSWNQKDLDDFLSKN